MFPLSGRETTVDDNILLELCERARMMDVINRYPKQLDARVGEGAKFLSGGEQQRLAIIRTLAKNPMLLVLDEATASLDTHNEERIQQLIQEASHGRTTIIIAHRLSTLRFVDRIVVMHKGSVVDIGTHEQLLERCEIYQNLVSKQTLALSTT